MLQYQTLVREERQQWLEQLAHPLRSSGLYVSTHSDFQPNVEHAVLSYIVCKQTNRGARRRAPWYARAHA
jgi:hypothetical protein